jgi:hypothetical protein
MNLVWSSTLAESAKRFVMLALADTADDQGKVLRLRIPTLCRKTGISRSTMFELLRKLESDDRLIQRDERTGEKGSRLSSRFWINVPLLRAIQIADDDLDDEGGSTANPFVSAGPTPSSTATGGYPQPVRDSDGGGSEIRTGPVREPDGTGVRDSDGGGPRFGQHDPSSCSEEILSVPTDGSTDGVRSPTKQEQDAAATLINQLDFRTVDARPRQRGQIRDLAAVALAAGYSLPDVSAYLRTKLAEARTVAYVLGAFAPDRLVDITATDDQRPIDHQASVTVLPPACDECLAHSPAAQRNPRLRLRRDPVTGGTVRCDCHPDVVACSTSTTPKGTPS